MRQHLEGIQTESGWFVDTEASATGYVDNQRCKESSVNTMERHREQGKPDAGTGTPTARCLRNLIRENRRKQRFDDSGSDDVKLSSQPQS